MPNNPQSLAEMLSQCLTNYWHALYAFSMGFGIAILRSCYLRRGRKFQAFIEALICGGLALSSRYVFLHLDMHEDLAVAFGSVIGLTGVDKIRELSFDFLRNKMKK